MREALGDASRRGRGSDRRARRRQRVLPRGADPGDRRGARATRCPTPCWGWCRRASTPRGTRPSACCGRRACSASASRAPGWRRCWAARPSWPTCRDAIERLAARELVARAATPDGRADAEFTFRHALVREAAYAMLTDDDRAARPPAGRRLAGAGGGGRRDGARRALPARRRAGARGALVPSAPRRRRCGPTTSSPRSSGRRSGWPASATAEAAGQLRLIQAEAHVWRGELDVALARALEAAALLAPGSGAVAARAGAGDHRGGETRAAGRGRTPGRPGRRDAVRARSRPRATPR